MGYIIVAGWLIVEIKIGSLISFDSLKTNIDHVFSVKGGRFIVANLHPIRSATEIWHGNEGGEKLHVILDNYFDEGERYWETAGIRITNK